LTMSKSTISANSSVTAPTVDPQHQRSNSGILSSVRTRLRGPLGQPGWERPALLIVLLSNAVLYFTNIGVSGWANSFYSAAVQAGTMDWTAFFFGSSDWGNAITVDKPP
jgi:hypothetical protein